MSLQHLATFGRITFQILAILLVLFALAVSLIRGLLPHVPEVRQDILTYVDEQYDLTIQIGDFSAKWQAYGPSITINQLVLPPQQNIPFTLISDQVHIKLDFWQSLLTLSPQIETVSFDGVDVAIHLDELPTSAKTPSSNTNLDWLYALLLEQLAHFSINDVTVQLFNGQHDFKPIFVENLEWLNTPNEHRAKGLVYIDQDASQQESLSLAIALKGDGYKPDSLTGEIYLAAEALDLGKWASRRSNPKINIDNIDFEGVVNIEAWFNFANRSVDDGYLLFKPSWLQWHDNDESHTKTLGQKLVSKVSKKVQVNPETMQRFDIQSGVITWQKNAQGWHLQSHDLLMTSNGENWPKVDVILASKQQQMFALVNQINVQHIAPLLPLIPNFGRKQVALWQDIKLTGNIGPIKLYKPIDQPWLATANLNKLEWQPISKIPGLSPIDAQLIWTDNELTAVLPQQAYRIDFAGGFNQPLALTGQALTAKFNPQTLQLTAESIRFSNDDIKLNAALKMDFSADAHMALAANLDILDVTKASNYFPLMAMSPNLVSYLDSGLQAGQIHQAQVVWHGAFNQYPYTQNNGIFQAEFDLTEGQFKFQPDWPEVTELDLSAIFENKLMDLTINTGKLGKVAVDGAKVIIPELGKKSLLLVTGDLHTEAQHATAVINDSPLKSNVGETLAVVQISQDINVQLDLSIPLYEGQKPLIKGAVNFENNPVFISKPGVHLTEVTGGVRFKNSLVSGQNLHAQLFSQPLQFSFETKNRNKQLVLDVEFDGRWDLASLPQSFETPLSDYYQGEFDWTGHLMMMFGDQGYSIRAQAESDLNGVSVNLPRPYTKAADEPRLITAELLGDNKQSALSIKLANQAEFWGGFSDEEQHLAFYELMLGRQFKLGDKLAKQAGRIHVDFKQANFDQWQPIIDRFIKKGSASQQSEDTKVAGVFPPLVQINAKVRKFNLLAQDFTQLNLLAQPLEDIWRFDVDSEQFVGRVDFYPSWREQGIKIVADKLHLSPHFKTKENGGKSPDSMLQNMPPLAVDVDDFKVFDMQFGHLEMQATPSADGYIFQTISLTEPNKIVNFQGKGTWKNTATGPLTQFDVDLSAAKFDTLSTMLGINPGLQNAPLKLVGDFSWQGAPYDFSLETLNGQLKFDFGKGHLSEISDKGARIFSLFSLDSILRKLSFDFSDVFGKGLYFDSFNGNLAIQDGVVKTTDTEMDAVAGTMRVRGFTDLTTQSLNYDIRFVPQLASSVPTVVFLSTSAWTLGIGAFALTKVLEPVIEVISEIRFRLTGTMDSPELQELERKSKEIEIPESILRENGVNVMDDNHSTEAVPASQSSSAPLNPGVTEPQVQQQIDTQQPQVKVEQDPQQSTNQSELQSEPKSKTQQQHSTNVVTNVAANTKSIYAVIEPYNKQNVNRDSNASQFVTMSKQQRCSSQSCFYQQAA
ncbi:YhdP family protein [Shewanella gaetbuli]|uniref:TIGR02099 family protein n=1 Tax=Shewanella gaetbuli TaxID=220752 RepID=A0A9X1ZLJ3_9GAMM|nr:TIGR02099 family protein [Shewanella gaetbuli]